MNRIYLLKSSINPINLYEILMTFLECAKSGYLESKSRIDLHNFYH